jgi:ATP-dependent Lon protease
MFITKKEFERRVEKRVCEALEARERDRYMHERYNDIERRMEREHERIWGAIREIKSEKRVEALAQEIMSDAKCIPLNT